MSWLLPHGGLVTKPPVTLNFITSAVVNTDLTDYSGTFDGTAIGTATDYSTRRIVLSISHAGSGSVRTVSTVTVGGQSLAQDVHFTTSVYTTDIWSGLVSSGNTADIDIVLSGAGQQMMVGVWALDNAATSTSDTLTNGNDPYAGAITIPTKGAMIAVAMADQSGGTMAWTNATERFDAAADSDKMHSGADSTTAGTPTITADPSGTANAGMAAAAWAQG